MLRRINPSLQEGLEIGPLSRPIVTKADAAGSIWYVDYATKETLQLHYREDPNVRVDEIVQVDYLWGERSLRDVVGGRQFDYIVASHVIEHVPDMLGWLEETAQVLRDNGILSLAVPDKRYSFDRLRELSTMGMLLEAHWLHRRRPGPREIFDHLSLASKVDVHAAWTGQLNPADLVRYHDLKQAFDLAEGSRHTEEYQDTHVNVFTPSSFLELLETAARLNLLDFAIADFCDTPSDNLEFFVSLERLSRRTDPQGGLETQLASFAWARRRVAEDHGAPSKGGKHG